jgi:hypothetical protein
MATQSILRNSIVSPIRTTLQRPRSILKRPISPVYPFASCFSLQGSPSLRSPHVQFFPSPSLVSTFTTHSAGSYDRAPISVSPLERTYVTSLEGFQLSAPPRPSRSLATAQNSPAITDFEDPRSPKVQPEAKQNNLRFAAFTSTQLVTRSSRTLAKSMASYPRSPYPSASLVPPAQYNDMNVDNDLAHRPRASSLFLPKRNKKGLTLGSSAITPAAPTPSSLGRSVFSPAIDEGKKPAPLDLESRLSQAFWEALSIEEAVNSADEVMVTALEYPPSAVEPQITYADAHGALWSPALPKAGVAVHRIRESLMSPAKRSSIGKIVRQDFTAPSPNDPFAAFPSFTAAMERDSSITYPSRVALEYGL